MSSAAAPPSRLRGRLARLLAGCTLAYAVVLVMATHYPKPERFLGKNLPSDKTLHFIAYGTLAVLAGATFAVAGRRTPRQIAGLAAGLAAFAAVDEITQPLFSRALERLDWVFDCVGIALGLAVVAAIHAVVRSCYRQLGVGGR